MMHKNTYLQLLDKSEAAYYSYTVELKYNSKNSYLLSHDKDTLYVAFRGTDELGDWFGTNLKFLYSTHGDNTYCSVHKGFLTLANLFVLDTDLMGFIGDYEHVYFTGHSMGAAIALLASLEAKILRPDHNVQYCGFACPPVGNRTFNKEVLELFDESTMHQVRNVFDVVNYMGLPYYSMAPGKTVWGFRSIFPHHIMSYQSILDRL